MHKVYYVYNPRTACYDRIYPTFRQRAFSVFRRVLVFAVVCLLGVCAVLFWVIGPAKMVSVADDRKLKARYRVMDEQLDEALEVLDRIRERDANLYRVMVQADPPADPSQNGMEADYAAFEDSANAVLLASTQGKVERLRRQLYMQSLSFDEIVAMCRDNTEKLQCIPSIQPIKNGDLEHLSSGFGIRIDPVFGTAKMHTGLDFTAQTGTPILATGAGVVSYAQWKEGYGLCTIIDHGYGYQTLYGHQDRILVREGQSVKRGDVIGHVGNTGKSTGPHLHYEVMIRGRKVNPVNFFSRELTPEKYDELLRKAAMYAGVFD